MSNIIPVTKPFLAPLEEFIKELKPAWESGILTHNGPLVQNFEKKLAQKLGVKDFIAVTNGTVALQMAIRALELKGEIITTPFSWVATVSAIKWENCTPVLCDIDPDTLNIDPNKIEALITDKTVAIMPVHVFGNPCDVEAIKVIADKYNLKVIYDAAHALGSTYNEESIFNWGDISATSLHATKLLNTAEGGGCVSTDQSLVDKLKRIRFFGHDDNKEVVEDGFNGKMTEVHAALGIANINYYDAVIEDRKDKYFIYKNALKNIEGITFQELRHGKCNYAYFPVIFENEGVLTRITKKLNEANIYPRRYFYPSLNKVRSILGMYNTPISENISSRILCLPLYMQLTRESQDRVIEKIIYELRES